MLSLNSVFKALFIIALLFQFMLSCDLLIPLKPTANIEELARINGENQRALAVGIEDHYGFFCYLERESGAFNLDIYDLKNPGKPQQMSTLNNVPLCEYGSRIHNMLIRENFVYINSPHGLVIIDVHDRENPTVCSTFQISSRDPSNHPIKYRLSLKESYLFLADDSLRIFDITDKRHPRLLLPATNFKCADVEVVDTLLFMRHSVVKIVSCSDIQDLKE